MDVMIKGNSIDEIDGGGGGGGGRSCDMNLYKLYSTLNIYKHFIGPITIIDTEYLSMYKYNIYI